MINIFRLFFTVAVFWFDLVKGHGRCTFEGGKVDLRKMPLAYQLDEKGMKSLIYPDPDRKFTVDEKSKIVFSCVNSSFDNFPLLNGIKDIEVTCLEGTKFVYNDQTYEYAHFVCKEQLRTVIQKFKRNCLTPNGNTVINLGYQTQNYFFKVFSVCFDENKMNTLYTWYKMRVPFYDNHQDQKRTRFFYEDIFGTLNVNLIYTTTYQLQTINSILNLGKGLSKHMDEHSLYLSKGHFTSKTDFDLAHEQVATFSYLNIFPQWSNSNQMWAVVEKAVRTENAKNRSSKRAVASGVYGSFTLPDHERKEQELHLVYPQKQVSVPKFQWKLIYDADNEINSVVYIGYNNPKSKSPADMRGQIDCARKPCPEVNNVNPSLNLYCCDIASFQIKYGKLDSGVFDVEPKAEPATAA